MSVFPSNINILTSSSGSEETPLGLPESAGAETAGHPGGRQHTGHLVRLEVTAVNQLNVLAVAGLDHSVGDVSSVAMRMVGPGLS